MSFVSEASVPAQRNLYGEEDRIQRSGFLICLGRMWKDGELFAIFLMEMRRKRRLTKKNHPDYEKARFEAGSLLRIHSLLGRQRKNSGCLFQFFFFVLRWTWERFLGWENCKTRLLIFGVPFVRDHTKIEDFGPQ